MDDSIKKTSNDVLEEMMAVLNGENYLIHYGVKRRSGRYPWGSGKDPYQHSVDFLSRVDEMRKSGFKYVDENGKEYTGDTAIAKSLGLTTTQFRTEIGLANNERRILQVNTAKRLRDKEGLGATEIGRRMGISESSVRSLLNPESENRMKQAIETADFLRKHVDEKGMIDVGTGVERELKISKEKLDQALYILERDGYEIYKGGIPQVTNIGQQTNQRVLCRPGTEHKEIYNFDKIHTINDYISRDGGDSYEKKFHYPESLDSKRLAIRYAEDGGITKDGLVEIRRGVQDLSLGESRYSQVRIMVDGTHYIKGMAVYSDNLPPGVDVVFNTNKTKDVSKMNVLKEIKNDPLNPFGSSIKDADQGGQYWYVDKNTGEKKLGLINKRAHEGDWTEWKDSLPSQFLAKQSYEMARKQLELARADKYAEFDEIMELTNPTVKKHLLQKFADECDSAAVDLKAAALPGQKYHVILPINSLKDSEVYAPRYENGTKIALIRYPHGGTFEIPILTVNNKNIEAKKMIGPHSIDAVGITYKNAERLSGADFDGDTVMVIPTHDNAGRVKITSTPPLKGLEGFDAKMEYPERPGMKYMKDPKTGKDNTPFQMGSISNLITDMTIFGATDDELARAVRHSMVVIDAAKHKLDYRKSEIDNDIESLRKKYQIGYDKNGKIKYGGASTILSRSSGETSVIKRQGESKINIKDKPWYDPSKPEGSLIYKISDDAYYPVKKYNKVTGEMTLKTIDGEKISFNVNNKRDFEIYNPVKKINSETGEVYFTNADGSIKYKFKERPQKSVKMLEVDNAYDLISARRHPKELLYADHANNLKALANTARKEMMMAGKIEYNRAAKMEYQKEVYSLMNKLDTALLNATKERAAQRLANVEVASRKMEDPNMKVADIKKAGQRAIEKYRQDVGSVTRRERNIEITEREWEAIQKGAISENKLKQILNNTDIDKLREFATPKTTKNLSPAKINRIKALRSSNYTLEEIANKLGVSTSTVSEYLKGE